MTLGFLLALGLLLGAVPALAGESSASSSQLTAESAESASMAVLESDFLDSEPTESTLEVERTWISENGKGHTRVQQIYNGVPVFEGESIVHINPDGSTFAITDDLKKGIDLDTSPKLTAEEAIELALLEDAYDGKYSSEPEADLLILTRTEAPTLTWRVKLARMEDAEKPGLPIYFVDAQTGEIPFSYDNLQTSTGTGSGNYYSNVSLNTWYDSGTYYLQDTASCSNSIRRIATTDMNDTWYIMSDYTDADNVWGGTNTDQRSGVDAHFGAYETYTYFEDTFDRNGIDDNYGPKTYRAADNCFAMAVGVHWGYSTNAAWDTVAHRIRLGEGDDQEDLGPFTYVDTLAHEWTHGITEYTAALTYAEESGALNESWSDVFGEMVQLSAEGSNDWIVVLNYNDGDTIGYRHMDDPHDAPNKGYTADDDPDHYSERYGGEDDNGGVHINSGIPNNAFYLLVEGGTHNHGGSMTGIGATKAAAIWYEALTEYMTSGMNFAGARQATVNAAAHLYGGGHDEMLAVEDAWDLVGVGLNSGYIDTYAGTGTAGYSGDSGQATSAKLNSPSGVALDTELNLYIADTSNHRIRKVSPTGIITTVAGNGTQGSSGDDGAATSANLSYPRDIAIDEDGQIFIADTVNNKIRKVDTSGDISTYAGTGTAGYSGDGSAATSAKLNSPWGITLNSFGDLYIADASNHVIRRVDASSGNISTVAGTGSSGYTGDGGAATQATLNSPRDVAIDDSVYVFYISDTQNHVIRKVDDNGDISTFAGTGTAGFSGDGGAATNAKLNFPAGLFVSGEDDDTILHIADRYNHRIRKVWIQNGTPKITTVAGNGSSGDDGDEGVATSAKLNYPYDVCADRSGHIFIDDHANHKIREVY